MSKSVIEGFKFRHQSIVDSIDQIMPLTRSYIIAKPKIREMNERLISHLSHQDGEFFGRLRTYYQNDREVVKLVEFLMHDLKDMKVKYLIFFEKYTGEMDDIGSRNFPLRFTEFSRDVIARIKIEEEYLFPLIEKCPNFPSD